MISTKNHGILDYMVGGLLIAAPWLLGFADNSPAMLTAVTTGVATLMYSLITDYEYSLVAILSFKIHRIIDIMSGLFLIISPLLFRFSEHVFWPHVTVGIIELVVVLFTKRKTRFQKNTLINKPT